MALRKRVAAGEKLDGKEQTELAEEEGKLEKERAEAEDAKRKEAAKRADYLKKHLSAEEWATLSEY